MKRRYFAGWCTTTTNAIPSGRLSRILLGDLCLAFRCRSLNLATQIPEFSLLGCRFVKTRIPRAFFFPPDIEMYKAMKEALTDTYSELPAQQHKTLRLGQACVARYSLDEKYYRAKILNSGEKGIEVRPRYGRVNAVAKVMVVGR